MLRLLFYPNQYTSISEAQAHELSWEDFKDIVLREAEVVPNKGSEAQYFPGEMIEGADSKGDTSVESVHLYCADCDNITPAQYQQLLDIIQQENWECAVHSTYSHHAQIQENGNYRVRVVFTLSRPVLADEWRLFWANMFVTLKSMPDEQTAHPSKHFLAASMSSGEEAREARIYEEFDGTPIDVEEMLERHGIKKIAHAEVESFEIGKETITGNMYAECVSRRRRGDDAKVANALKAAAAKNPYAETGAREATLFAIAGLLAHEFPRGNPDDLCEPLRYSIEFEEKRGGPKYSEFRDKVIRRQRDLLQRAAVKRMEAAKEAARVAAIKAVVEEFTPESLEPYIKSCGEKFVFKDLKDRLVLIHRNGFYVFDGDGYKYATAMSLLANVRKYLQFRAEEHLDFSYYFPSEGNKPPVPKSNDAFVKDHGDTVDQVRYTYLGHSWYDPKKSILQLSEVESPTRLVPERCPKVEAWMRVACPDERLRKKWEQWMAQYANTQRALVGLVLNGPSGTGKSAFAEGMAKMHGDAPPCSMANYLSAFNSEVLLNPLVFADECLPEINGRVPTDKLRTLISSGTHEVNRKGQPIAILDGFVRTIMAFQNLKKFDFGRGHTREDIEAIEKRFLFIELMAEASEYFDYDLFVTHKALIKHAMYLSQTMPRSSDRFGVDTAGADHVVSGDPVAMCVADWLIEYLMQKMFSSQEVQKSNKRVSAFINKERLFVNVTLIRKEWEQFKPSSNKFQPSQQQLAEAIRSMAVTGKAARVRMASGHESFWELKTSILKSRAVALDLCSEEQFDLMMKIPHELSFKGKTFILTDAEKQERIEALKLYRGKSEGVG
jgi:adenylate kinase family enzyme